MFRFKYLLLSAVIVCSSCRTTRSSVTENVFEDGGPSAMAGVVHTPIFPVDADKKEEALQLADNVDNTVKTTPEEEIPLADAAETGSLRASSFTQMQEMAASGQLKMNRRDTRTLNRLAHLYKGDFKDVSSAFEMTTPAWIIAGIGVTALLIALLAGSFFFGFVFLLAVVAFILRWADVIQF